RVGLDSVAVVLAVQHAVRPPTRAEGRIVRKPDRLRVDVARVDQLGAHDPDVIGDAIRACAALVVGVDVRAARAGPAADVDQPLIADQRYSLLTDAGLCPPARHRLVYPAGHAQPAHDCRLVAPVLRL